MKKICLVLCLCTLGCTPKKEITPTCTPTQYLAFQLFASGNTEPSAAYGPLAPLMDQTKVRSFFEAVHQEVGESANPCRMPAVIIGPLAMDFKTADITALIQQSFQLATTYNIAVGFHIDDGMFWGSRQDLWKNPDNIEWTDWNGTPNTSRYVDWVSGRLAPMMCFNAPQVKSAVREFMTNIAAAIKTNVDLLPADRKNLYAGTIVGWETSLDKDRDTQKTTGYHGLSYLGFSTTNPPADVDAARVQLVHDYMEWMAVPFYEAGLPESKTFAHIAFLSKEYYDYAVTVSPDFAKQSYSALNNFSIPEVLKGKHYVPGISTYPQAEPAKLFQDIYSIVGEAPWVAAESANVILSNVPLPTGYNTESFLARHYNHGCVLVNVFAFNLRGDPFTNAINDATEGADAIAAYKKFLRGEALKE
ncbi:MAG: hypothetical protein U0289_06785 [Cyclobacteriaceae bacterium]|nr:hypothetical protein [Cytophagales bacterium]HNP76876.1 hypothetical protein [Cyclobacteriaceae bacterium]